MKGYCESKVCHAAALPLLTYTSESGILAIRLFGLFKRFSSSTAMRMSRRVSPGSTTLIVTGSLSMIWSNLLAE